MYLPRNRIFIALTDPHAVMRSESGDLRLQRTRLPRLVGDTPGAEEDGRDGAIGCALRASVDAAHSAFQALAALLRERWIGSPFDHRRSQALRRRDADRPVIVERDQHPDRRSAWAVRRPDENSAVAEPTLEEARVVSSLVDAASRQRHRRDADRRHRRDQINDGGRAGRVPEDRPGRGFEVRGLTGKS